MNISDHKKSCYADSLAFLAPLGKLPVFPPSKRPQLQLAHLTSVSPLVKDADEAIRAHRGFVSQVLSNTNVRIIRRRGDLNELSWGMNVLLGMQHTPNGITAGQLRELRDEGLRVMSIVDDEDNDYGSGYKGSGGLTEHGKWLIRMLPELGIILDLPANQRTALDILELIWREGLLIPVMASHSGCKTVYASPRNLSDEIMSGIARLNGYYGIPLISSLIATQHCGSYLEEFTRHVKHAVRQIGPKRVGIGSGCPHIDMTLDEAREHFEKMVEMLGTDGSLGEYFPDRPMEAILCGSTLFRYLEQALQSPSLEFSEETIRGICGENFERFLHRSLPRV